MQAVRWVDRKRKEKIQTETEKLENTDKDKQGYKETNKELGRRIHKDKQAGEPKTGQH